MRIHDAEAAANAMAQKCTPAFSTVISGQLPIASGLNVANMKMCSLIAGHGGFITDPKETAKALVDCLVDVVMKEYPIAWNSTAKLVDVLTHFKKIDLTVNTGMGNIIGNATTPKLGLADLHGLRTHAVAYMGNFLGAQVYMFKNEEGAMSPRPYFPPIVHKVFAKMLELFDMTSELCRRAQPALPFVEVNMKKDIEWADAMMEVFSLAWDGHEHCQANDAKAFHADATALEEALSSRTNAGTTWPPLLHQYKVTLPKNSNLKYEHVDLCPNEKKEAISMIMSAFRDSREEAAKSQRITESPYEWTMNMFKERHLAALAAKPADPDNPADEEELMTVSDWHNMVMSREEESGMNTIRKKQIMATLQSMFSMLPAHAYLEETVPAETVTEGAGVSAKDLQKCCNLRLKQGTKGEIIVERSAGPGTCRTPMWGRIVDLDVAAATSNRAVLVDIGDNGGRGPRLFIHGGNMLNWQRADSCVAWAIPPLPKKKQKEEQPAQKKLKPTKEDSLVATHKIEYEPIYFDLSTGEKCEYFVPHMVEILGGRMDQKLYREATELDTEELANRASKPTMTVRSFFLS